ncbi:MAG: DctP family TRAP transporter solute-binding subunit [Candidatus Rokubacteria bacterium]|nr:DctP family TRAP transporter solute-binding subunit [Candidatus Rokubacteria bacterium]MBI4592667.1 DctP family TRAP transporter solute-binding subunit [Candidatus Rokubacteria bacterium]
MKLALALALMLLLAPPVAAQEVKIRFAGNLPPANSNSKAMEVFKQEVEKRSRGTIKVDTFPAMQLGGAKDNLDQVKTGTLQAAYLSTAFMTGFVPKLGVFNLPFLFKDRDTAFKILDGSLGKELEREMERTGFKNLGFWENGWRHMTNSKRPITTAEDLSGLKVRLQNNSVHLRTFKLLGANPVPMDIKEVYSAMQQGVIDGHENPFCNTLNLKFYEVQKHLSVSGHFYDLMGAIMNKRFYDGLPKDKQQLIDAAARTATDFQRKQAVEDDLRCLEELKKKGMQVNTMSTPALAKFRELTQPVYKEFERELTKELIDRFVAANK